MDAGNGDAHDGLVRISEARRARGARDDAERRALGSSPAVRTGSRAEHALRSGRTRQGDALGGGRVSRPAATEFRGARTRDQPRQRQRRPRLGGFKDGLERRVGRRTGRAAQVQDRGRAARVQPRGIESAPARSGRAAAGRRRAGAAAQPAPRASTRTRKRHHRRQRGHRTHDRGLRVGERHRRGFAARLAARRAGGDGRAAHRGG
eukprot:595483-Pleurochrysis_carterae.AAC.1